MTPETEKFLARAKPIGCKGFACSCCGKPLQPDDKVLDCSDCGALFCENCVRDGSFDNHECEPDDLEED